MIFLSDLVINLGSQLPQLTSFSLNANSVNRFLLLISPHLIPTIIVLSIHLALYLSFEEFIALHSYFEFVVDTIVLLFHLAYHQ